jgi:hypothetical protein
MNRLLRKSLVVTLNQVLNLIQDLTNSGSADIMILLDAETILNQVQHKVQHDILNCL